MDFYDFLQGLKWDDLPAQVQHQAKRCLLDTLGVGVGGSGTRLSRIVRDHTTETFGGAVPMLFDGRRASAAGVALAAGMTIDSLDGHDGFNPSKGHIGCPVISALLPVALREEANGEAFLTAMVAGYEFGARTAIVQHATVPDYHTSGSWGAVAGAAACARLMGLDRETTRHAMGIAEYHGPRSQMMRCIDHPTMVKDGSGWGAMCAVQAVDMARRGFTGAPAITVEDAPETWGDLGDRWYIMEQYFKPYPVCRWAQAPVEGVLALRRAHQVQPEDVARIEVETFHEAIRLATRRPQSTEAAQYSTSFPCAVAMVRGGITATDISDDALTDPDILRLSDSMILREDAEANRAFPGRRLARITLELSDGRRLTGDWLTPRWDATEPPSDAELREKFDALTVDALGRSRSARLADVVNTLDALPVSALVDQLAAPISAATTAGNAA
jgi:2-methylcitrate dehydratase PrpD